MTVCDRSSVLHNQLRRCAFVNLPDDVCRIINSQTLVELMAVDADIFQQPKNLGVAHVGSIQKRTQKQ